MIEIKGLGKRYGKLDVLRDVNLDIAAGRVTAVVGPNASGKTTLIKAILGLVKPDSGSIRVDGHVLNGDWRYRANVGYMPQAIPFPENLTGAELLSLLEDLRGGNARLDHQLIEDFALNDELGKPLRTLSGGTRQKVNAVIAFLFRPELLILDEPSAGLDPVASGILKRKISGDQAEGRSFIITSHNLGELEELSDDVVFLLDGRVRFAGSLPLLQRSTGQASLERAIARLMLEQEDQVA